MKTTIEIHYADCEAQPKGAPCICDSITEELEQANTDIQIDDAIAQKAVAEGEPF